ncbi:hypothetical protein HMPREF1544_01250 [Mucor circinelloides 1006PhL]|uniref:C2H2-type domain-containing protein n=1 Tax=Mucor circinelloides f. circinelloides (strain 1006PhL) TaxID=1220926 RepID=S2JNR4_MUCC1|nr:hypothetical protein HMPREF1544_01250 [Mucor circinelloides 1006PhL]
MKLRDRQKRVSNDIKQEDKKAAINLIDTPSSTFNESSAYSFNIKQEDTKNDNSLLQQDDRFEEGKDYFYRCDICSQRMPNLKSVLQHRKSIHNISRFNHRIIKDVNTEPDIHSPNFYCRSCKVIYKDRIKYRDHLRHVHFMVLKTILKSKSPRSTIVPDPDDPSLHCRACDHTYAQKSSYKKHCQYKHGITSAKFGTAKSKPDGIVDTYCKICDVRLSSKKSYKQHLFAIHKVDWRLNQQKSKDIAPDVNDPNFYCCACETKLSCKGSFRLHLMAVHAIYLSAPKKIDLEPDTDDPNNNCRACKKNYISRSKYRNHLRLVHHMALPRLRRNVNLGSLPNPNDPHHYCSVCKRSYGTRAIYRFHCKAAHFMLLDHHSISNPNATIDVNHPSLYCAQCEHSYNTNLYFKKHLRRVHNI